MPAEAGLERLLFVVTALLTGTASWLFRATARSVPFV
jgi:hypothetical protein